MNKRELPRVLTLGDLTFLVVGAVIGSGIFIVPATVLRQTGGDVGVSVLVWLLAGLLSLLGALTYGELCAMQPEAGGIYVFIRDGFGDLPAFLYGWTLFLVISSGSVATLAVAFSGYLGQLFALTPLVRKMVSIAMILVVTAINVKGTRDSANVQNWTTSFKASALLVIGLLLIFSGHQLGQPTTSYWPASVTPSLVTGVLTAMIGVLWAYEGWQYATFSAGETINPQRTFPRGIILGTSILIVLYCLANIAYIAALGPARAAASDRVAAEAVGVILGARAGKLIAVAILVSMFSAANAITLTAPRVFYAMARDGIFFKRLALVHASLRTPVFAIIALNVVSVLLALTGTFEQLLTYVVFTGWIFYALGAASIFVYRRRRPDAARPFRVPGYPVTPLLFVLSAAVIVVNATVTQPGRAAVGIAIVLAGAPAYLIWRNRGA